MSKRYQYLAKKRRSPLYEGVCDLVYCKFKKSHIYTSNCFCCLNRYTRVGRTRRQQQTNDRQTVTVPF
jgi:hypothetical protein